MKNINSALGINIPSDLFESISRLEKLTSTLDIPNINSSLLADFDRTNRFIEDSKLLLGQSQLIDTISGFEERMRPAREVLASISNAQSVTESLQIKNMGNVDFPAIDYLKDLSETSRLTDSLNIHSKLNEQFSALQKLTEVSNLFSSQSRAISELAYLKNQDTFRTLAKLKNSPFARLDSVNIPEFNRSLFEDEFEALEIDPSIEEEIVSVTDFYSLSENTKRILLYVYDKIFLPLVISVIAAYIVVHVEEARKQLRTLHTPSEVKSFVRSPNTSFDRTALSDYRVTSATMLNFRTEPSMKSEVIAKLPIGTLVEIIDKTNRSWLFVEVEIDGEYRQGWVARRYTIYFK